MRLFTFFTLCLSLILTACTSTPVNPDQTGKIIDLRTSKTITANDLVSRLATSSVVLLGEDHESATQHQLETWLVNSLSSRRPQGSLLLEMLRVDQQATVDQLMGTDHVDRSSLPDQLHWQRSWNWDFYGDVVMHPFTHHYALVATNLTQGEIAQLMQGAEPLRGYASTQANIQQRLAQLITANHHGQIDQDMLGKLVQVQQFRDRRMAEKVLHSPKPTLLIAGNYHVQRDLGVPVHLDDLQHTSSQKIHPLVVMMRNTSQGLTAQQADFLWLIPEGSN